MSDVVTIAPKAAQAHIDRLENEVAALRAIMQGAYRALQDGRRGDALKLLKPLSITAPIAATGDQA